MAYRRKNGSNSGQKNPPVYSRRFYTGSGVVEAAVWERTVGERNSERLVYNVTVSRTYKDGDEYKRAYSFFPQDVPALALALQDCAFWIAEQESKR